MDEILFHPPLVHFPIALAVFEFFLLLLAVIKKDPALLRFARLTFWTLFALLPLALLSGYKDSGAVWKDLFEGALKPHVFSAFALTLIAILRFWLWRIFNPQKPQCVRIQLAAAFVMAAAAILTGHWGGKLVYS